MRPDRELLVVDHIPLAKHIVNKYVDKENRLEHISDEMLSAALEGLCRAAVKYDVDKYTTKFSTYAWYVIRGAVLDYLKKEGKHFDVAYLEGVTFVDGSGDVCSWYDVVELESSVSEARIPIDLTYHEKLLLHWSSNGALKATIRSKLRKMRADTYENLLESIISKLDRGFVDFRPLTL